MRKAPAVSVVIPVFGRPELALKAVAAALAQRLPGGRSFEVLVVDDGGPDGPGFAAALRGLKRRTGVSMSYLRQEHAGPAAARNYGARVARAPLLAFLDSDTVAQPGWLAAGCQAMETHLGWLGCEGRTQAMPGSTETPYTHKVENQRGGQWLTCNLFVQRKDFLDLKGFDERFKRPMREDSEFAFRALEAGHVFGFAPAALVLHPVLPQGVSRFYRWARDGQYEALLERQHPLSYRRHLSWIYDRAMPVYYRPVLFAPLVALAGFPFAALACAGLGIAGTLAVWCRRRKVTPGIFAALVPAALLVPFLRLAWVAKGYIRYPSSPE